MSQQTARSRTKHLTRRAAAVSAGAFALCLAAATPAMADLDPVPLPDISPVTDALAPVTDVVDPVVPVTKTIADVEKTVGVSTDTPTTKPKPKPDSKPTAGDRDTTSGKTRDGADRQRQHREPFSLPGRAAVSPAYVPTWTGSASDMPGLRSALADAEAPAVAAAATPERSVISLAGGALQDLGDAGTPAGRTVLIIISTLVIGTLAGGHVKAAQDRLMATTA
jgi:hypothetical protein